MAELETFAARERSSRSSLQGVDLPHETIRGYTPVIKTAIPIPEELFRAAECAATRLGLSRSELYQRAVASFLERQRDTLATDALSQVSRAEQRGELDPLLERMQRASLRRGAW